MELIDKLKIIIERLEKIRELRNPDLDRMKELIDKIESKELLNLDEEFDDWRYSLYEKGEEDKAVSLISQIDDLFVHAEEIINSIREQFDLYADFEGDESFRQENDENNESLSSRESNDKETNSYEIVLHEVSKSALRTIGIDNNDEMTISLMDTIILGICSRLNDDEIAGRAFASIAVSGFFLPMDKIKEICQETRTKCKKQILGLQIAYNSLQEYNCSADDALLQIQLFL